ncbi:MAG: hypothetical protein E7182_04600 [Erysipelotrichaceae bacterium]|nr:hypothetical protein [Erysipelotrichaceae bacterium]
MNINELSDEELVLSIRLGDPTAYQTLTARFFAMRLYSGRVAAPQWMTILDTWRFNEVFFTSFLRTVDTFAFRGVRFLTYYYRILAREMAHAGAKVLRDQERFRSLDDVVSSSDTGTYTLNDVVGSTEVLDDPAAFFRYAESLDKIGRLPRGMTSADLRVIRLRQQGYTVREIVETTKISTGKARYAIRRYVNWAVKIFAKVYDLDEAGQQAKRKLLESRLKATSEE